ncbi:MAG: glycosyltransferase, partial [Sphingobacteriales bacterium]
MMKVSVITATFNSAATLTDTLSSVRDQTYPLVEHLIIDGGSKDNTMEIVAGFPHIKQICS